MLRNTIIALLFFQLTFSATSSPQYRFTYDWFTSNIPVWKRVLSPYAGRPGLHYLEVGVFEGRSAVWMLENVLTHPSSTLTGIDLFPGDLQDHYLANLRLSGYAQKARTIKGRSQRELRRLEPDSYDIIYIDGGHTADMVLADAVLCWELLKTGGLLIFDDYQWKRETYPDELRPGMAIDAFITAYRNYLEIVHREYQAIVRKKEGPDLSDPYRTVLGDYVYAWQKHQLQNRAGAQPASLPDKERQLLETLIRMRPFGETTFIVDPRTSVKGDFRTLRNRLAMEFETRLPDHNRIPLWITAVSSLSMLLLGIGATFLVTRRRRD